MNYRPPRDRIDEAISTMERRGFFHIANSDIAQAYFEALATRVPDVMRIDVGIRQYYVRPSGLQRLKKELKYIRDRASYNLKWAEEEYRTACSAINRIDASRLHSGVPRSN